jgi:rhamnosyltransferase subunit B
MSSRIVINCWGSYGDVFPYIGVGKALQARGYHVTLALPRYYLATVEREGLDALPVGPDVDPADRDLIARVMDAASGPETLIRDWVMPALRQSYEQLREAARDADLIVSHPVTFAAPILAQQRGMPWVATALAPMSFFSASDLPVLPPTPWLAHLRRLGPWFGRLMVRGVRHATRTWSEPVYRLRAELGLPRGGDPIFEGQFSPMLNLALFSRVMAVPQADWPPHVEETGFVFYNGPDPLSPALEEFLASGPPPIVFTLGTSAVGAAGAFYEESAAAAARLRRRTVLLTGGFVENTPRRTISRDILIVDHAPHQLLFPRAAAIVHQGGIGTTGQALRAGRPALVVPHAHDQPDNAFRVTNLGVARTLFPKSYRADRVARELARLLDDTRYVARATEVAATVRSEDGASAAAAAIARLAGAPAPVAAASIG